MDAGFKNQERKFHGKCHERDCLAKTEILEPLVHGNWKSRELYELTEYQGSYKNFTSHLSRYVKRGYANKLGKRPSIYQITEYGMQCCIDDPFGYRTERIKQNKRLKNANTQVFFVNNEGGSGGNVQYIERPVNRDFGDELDKHPAESRQADKMPEGLISEQQYELAKQTWYRKEQRYLKAIEELKNKKVSEAVLARNQKEYENHLKTEERIRSRKEMVEFYQQNQMWLDARFFGNWGMYPVHVKGKNVWTKGNVEIMAKNNQELSREGHVKGILPPNAVLDGYFHITKKTQAGIYVIGEGMKEEKLMKW